MFLFVPLASFLFKIAFDHGQKDIDALGITYVWSFGPLMVAWVYLDTDTVLREVSALGLNLPRITFVLSLITEGQDREIHLGFAS